MAGDWSAALLGFLAGTLLAVVIADVEAARRYDRVIERKFIYGKYLTKVKLLWPHTLKDKGKKRQRGWRTKWRKDT